jgi:hypothetical protein
MQVDRDDGSVWVMIHCGSRGYGWQTANHYFYAGAALRGLPTNRREESWLRFDEPLGREYWAHHNSAANYAVANRHVIVRGVREALEDVFSASGEVFYEISHNLVQQETLVLPDGSTKRGFVHRKGATRSYDFSGFTAIETSGQWQVTLVRGDAWAVEVSYPAELERFMAVRRDGGALVLGYNASGSRCSDFGSSEKLAISARIVIPTLDDVELSGASKLELSGFEGSALDIDASGASSPCRPDPAARGRPDRRARVA